jgi:hypothetical protein
MSKTLTVRLDDDLSRWLAASASRSGVSQGHIVRDVLASAKGQKPAQAFMRLAGKMRGPKDLSKRKGFSRK